MAPARTEALALLRYPPAWEELGLPASELLALQVQTFRSGEDPNTEHYRYVAFQALLKAAPLSDERVGQYLVLVDADPDTTMARAALVDLLRHPSLTHAQFERVQQHPWLASSKHLPKWIRERLARAGR